MDHHSYPRSPSEETLLAARPDPGVEVEEQGIRLVLLGAGLLTVVLAAIAGSPTGMTLGSAFVLLAVAGFGRRRGG